MIRKIVFFSLSLIFITCAQQTTGPKIYSPSVTYDFGTVKQGEIVKHSFILVNNGDDLLTIDKVVSSCGCTAANPDKMELEPQESTAVKIEFNSQGRHGRQTKYISIVSNDTSNRSFRFTLTGEIETEQLDIAKIPKLELEETQHDFGIVEEGKVLDYTFTLKNVGGGTLEIKDVKTSCGCTAAVMSGESIAPGETGTLKVEFDTTNRFGRTSKSITIVSNDPLMPYKVLTIYAEISKKES